MLNLVIFKLWDGKEVMALNDFKLPGKDERVVKAMVLDIHQTVNLNGTVYEIVRKEDKWAAPERFGQKDSIWQTLFTVEPVQPKGGGA